MSKRELQALTPDRQELLDSSWLRTLYGKERRRLKSRTEETMETQNSNVDAFKGRVAELEARSEALMEARGRVHRGRDETD